MSDDDKNGAINANQGITLVGDANATHDTGFSPLFFGRSGRGSLDDSEKVLMYRGIGSSDWSGNSREQNTAYRMTSDRSVYPSSAQPGNIAYSLRCLVSTNNRTIIK